jgi:hypothetical protein
VCCGTKRLVEIQCPSDCQYLSSSRQHPPAAASRHQRDDISLVASFMRDLSDGQSRLCFALMMFLAQRGSTATHVLSSDDFRLGSPPLTDEDVAGALASLASTQETAARGVIFEHQASSLQATRLAHDIMPLLTEAERDSGPAFARNAAVVLRRLESAARQAMAGAATNRRAFLDLVGRVMRSQVDQQSAEERPEEPRIIVP